MAKQNIPGSFILRNERWYWTAKLPGEKTFKQRPMIPPGGMFATKDRGVAEDVARAMYLSAQRKLEQSSGISQVFDGTISGLVAAYKQHADGYYRHADGTPTTQIRKIGEAVSPLLAMFAAHRAEDIGPLKIQQVRDAWIDRPRPLCRSTINTRVQSIKAMFRWAVSQEMIPASTLVALESVAGLHKGRSKAKEPRRIKAVHPEIVTRTMEHMTPTLAAMVEIHVRTGMRSSEVCWMRPCDIDRTSSKRAWIYNVPQEANKNAYREGEQHERKVPLLPEVQQIIEPFLLRPPGTFCFVPAESDSHRRAATRATRTTGLDRDGNPYKRPRKSRGIRIQQPRYDKTSYRKAIIFAIAKANKATMAELKEKMPSATPKELADAFDAVKIPHWHPHQLRHTAATLIRKALGDNGRDAIRALLGQKYLSVTDMYAEVDQSLAMKAAEAIAS